MDRREAWEIGDALYNVAKKKKERKKDPKAKTRNRGKCVFPAKHPKVKDDEDHFPITSETQAANALSRAAQSTEHAWFDGTKEELEAAVKRKVYKEYPGLKERKEEREVMTKKKSVRDIVAGMAEDIMRVAIEYKKYNRPEDFPSRPSVQREIPQSNLSSECWSVQMQGLSACDTCDVKDTPDCGGQNIRATGKNELGFEVGERGLGEGKKGQKLGEETHKCSICGKPMNSAERMLGDVCGKCVRKKHKEVTGAEIYYELDCPNCHTLFEVPPSSVGKPPFDVECSNCGHEVGSEFIKDTYEID